MNNLDKITIIKRKNLDERQYFKSLINEAFNINLLDEKELNDIQIQILEILEKRANRYNGYESTSIRKEMLETIMESNMYTIGLYIKALKNPDDALNEIKTKGIISLYDKGRKQIDRKLSIARIIYERVLSNKINTKNYTYNSTIIDGIKGFFKIYEPDFNAQDIKITADYPLYNNIIGKLDGIEFIEEYLKSIYYENEFCNFFNKNAIECLLYSYSQDYNNLIINIFEIVLTQSIGCKIAKSDVRNLTITSSDLNKIYTILKDKSKIDVIIGSSYKELKRELFNANIELQNYIEKNLNSIKYIIKNALTNKNLDKVFITQKIINKF